MATLDKEMAEERQREQSTQTNSFHSRYLTDFERMSCLGKGGFGVVVQAKNKVDGCQYAVKRIRLPNCDEAREKVLREVKTLANLKHRYIVQYHTSWFEALPVGWLEDNKETFLEDSTTSDSSADTSNSHESQISGLVHNANYAHLSSTESGIMFCNSHTQEVSENGSASGNENSKLEEDTSGLSADASKSHESQIGGFVPVRHTYSEICGDSGFDSFVFRSNQVLKNGAASGNKTSNSKSSNAPFATSGQALLFGKYHKCKSEKCTPDTLKAPLYLFIQMELCDGNTLKDRLDDTTPIDPSLCLDIFEQIVDAVKYFHGRGVIHRDLKPANIFFSLDGSVKVGDFGLVTGSVQKPADNTKKGKSDANHTGQVGTHLYMSPEQIEDHEYSYKVDVFPLGLIFFELFQSFSTEMERIETMSEVRKKNIPEEFIKNMNLQAQLVEWMLADSPESRPTAAEICVSDLYKKIMQLHSPP